MTNLSPKELPHCISVLCPLLCVHCHSVNMFSAVMMDCAGFLLRGPYANIKQLPNTLPVNAKLLRSGVLISPLYSYPRIEPKLDKIDRLELTIVVSRSTTLHTFDTYEQIWHFSNTKFSERKNIYDGRINEEGHSDGRLWYCIIQVYRYQSCLYDAYGLQARAIDSICLYQCVPMFCHEGYKSHRHTVYFFRSGIFLQIYSQQPLLVNISPSNY